MTSDRKNPGVAFWATVVVVVLMAYPVSFGPACWWFSPPRRSIGLLLPHLDDGWSRAPQMYWPFGWLAKHGPEPIGDAIFFYATLRKDRIMLPTDPSGVSWVGRRHHWLISISGDL